MASISATLPVVSLYLADSRDEAGKVTKYQASDPQTKSDMAYFQKVAGSLTTPDKLLKDHRALSVVLNAFGVSGSIQSTALLKQLLSQDPAVTTSLANRLGDAKLHRLAIAMNGFKPPPFSDATNIAATVKAASTNSFEAAQDAVAPGLKLALYFKRNIAGVTTVNGLLSDASLLKVAVIGSGLDLSQFGNLDFAQQQTVLKKTIKFSNLQDPKKVDKMVQSYLVRQTLGIGDTTSSTAALSLINGTADGSSQSLLGAVYGQSATSSSGDILSALYPSTTSSTSTSLLQLFA